MALLPILDPKALEAPRSGGDIAVSTNDPLAKVQEQGFANIAQQSGRIASFLNKAAAPIAKSEGKTFGALNAPTIEQIETARQLGQKVTLPGDPSSFSIKQRAARAGALAVVEDRFEMRGRRQLTQVTLDAAANPDITPGQFGLMLDEIVKNHTEAMLPISPSAAAKVSASLALAANSQVQTFARNFATKELKKRKDESLQDVNTILDDLEATIFSHGGETTPDIVTSEKPVALNKKLSVHLGRIRTRLEQGGHSESKIKSTLTTAASRISDAKVAVVSDYANSPEFAQDPLGAQKQLDAGTLPTRVQTILDSMNPAERVEANKALAGAISRRQNAILIEQNVTTQQNKNLKSQAETDFSDGYVVNDLEIMQTAAALMSAVDGSKADAMQKVIDSRAGATEDDQVALQELDTLRANRNLTFGAIAKMAGRLKNGTLGKYIGQIKDQIDETMQAAEDDLKGEFQPSLGIPLSTLKGVRRDNTIKYQKAIQSLTRARRAFEMLPADDPLKQKLFDPQALVSDIITQTKRDVLNAKRASLKTQIARINFLPPDQRTPDALRKALHAKTGGFYGVGQSFLYSASQRDDIEVALEAMERLTALGEPPQ